MIVVMKPRSTTAHVDEIVRLVEQQRLRGWVIEGGDQTLIEVLGGNGEVDRATLERAPMVDRVLEQAYPMLAAGRRPEDQTLEVPLGAHARIGGRRVALIAGPCAVEDRSQLLDIAHAVKDAGAVALRGGAFKPRTSPYAFQGHGERGLEMLAEAREETGLAVVTEVMRCEHVELVGRYADILQIGSRNMHNTHLLGAAGEQSRPVLLKRGWCASLEEFLLAAEYIMLAGNRNVILCERGIRTHEDYVRNTLALALVPEIKRLSTLPVVVDPSHGTGKAHLVAPMSNAALACGADGLLVEVHDAPSRSWSDGAQTLDPEQFRTLVQNLRRFAEAADRAL